MLQHILYSPAPDHCEMIAMLTHFALSIASSAIIATAALVLAFLRIPHGEQWDKLSRARWILFATFALLSISGYFKSSDKDTELLSLVTLCVASFQALLFTYTSSTLIAPTSFSLRKFILVLAAVILCSLLLVFSKLLFPSLYHILWPMALMAYTGQLVAHTCMFHQLACHVQANLEEYYDEDVGAHLHPVRLMFYSALIIGLMALAVSALPMNTLGYNFFVGCYTLYYLSVAITMVNYITDGFFFVQAAGYEAEEQTGTEQAECDIKTFVPALKIALDNWIEQKLYLKNDTSTDLIARQLGVTRQQLAAYMRSEYGMTFRSWRMRLRLQYAQELIVSDATIKLSQVYEMAGFNDRSNFHKEFCKFAGMTPQAYKNNYTTHK